MYVYILHSCSLDQYYTGQSSDVVKRLERHNKGLVPSTKKGIPWRLVWHQKVTNRSEALILEKKIKGRGAGRYLKNIGM